MLILGGEEMAYRFLSDSHVHSDNSLDALDPIIKICESATALNLFSITFTDHCECDTYHKKDYSKAIKQSFFEAKKARAVFNETIHVFAGVELGQPIHNKTAAKDALKNSDFDFVLASIHKLKKDLYFKDYHFTNDNVHHTLDRYFDEILELIDWGKFDSLSHLQYPLKYIDPHINLELNKFEEKINLILQNLAKKKKALEVYLLQNSHFSSSILSESNVLSKFKKFGGKYITVGSNAHSYKDLGSGIENALKVAKKSGFSNFTVYKNRKPVSISIV